MEVSKKLQLISTICQLLSGASYDVDLLSQHFRFCQNRVIDLLRFFETFVRAEVFRKVDAIPFPDSSAVDAPVRLQVLTEIVPGKNRFQFPDSSRRRLNVRAVARIGSDFCDSEIRKLCGRTFEIIL